MERCVFCQGELEPTTRRCSRCGQGQPEPATGQPVGAAAETATKPCPHCGDLLPIEARFCGRCGQALPQLARSSASEGMAPDVGNALAQEPARSTGRIQGVLATLSGQILLADDKPNYLKGVTSSFNDVFISYSRKDKAFVRQVFQALAAANRQIWVDWEDIPPITNWQEEIYTGIETASTFVFVLSPDSLSSVPCQKEIEHAINNKKRIIPLVYRTFDPDQIADSVKDALKKTNWIHFEQSHVFDFAMEQLFFALDTDLDYWHQSARLLTGAKEWEKKKKERSSTLRGKDLKAAERWRAEGAAKIPPPGPPVTDFIAASVKQRKQSRILAVSILLVFLLTAGAAARFFLLLPPDPTRVTTTANDGTGSLRWAIANAPPGSTITFAPNVSGSIVLKSPLNISKNLTIQGPGAEHLKITYPNNTDFAMTVLPATVVTLSEVKFNSRLENSGMLTLTNSTVSGNTTTDSGGGIVNDQGTLTLMNSTVSGNSSGDEGGGIDNPGEGTLILTNSIVSNNSANYGAGIYNANGTVILTNSVVSHNTDIYVDNGVNSSDGSGGGINNFTGKVFLTNSTVSGNTAGYAGGGIENGGTLTMTNSTVSDNKAGIGHSCTLVYVCSGGGIDNNYGTLALSNSTIFGNIASGGGGGIADEQPQDDRIALSTIIIFCTISNNSAADGGGIYSVELDPNELIIQPQDNNIKLEVRNSIVIGNQSSSGLEISGTVTTEGYNLFQQGGATAFFDPDSEHATDKLLPADVSLAQYIDSTLHSNPGPDGKPAPTQTLALLNAPDNPAVEMIPVADCIIMITVTNLPTGNPIIDPVTKQPITITTDHDQRGMPRPGAHKQQCDIGAYESSG